MISTRHWWFTVKHFHPPNWKILISVWLVMTFNSDIIMVYPTDTWLWFFCKIKKQLLRFQSFILSNQRRLSSGMAHHSQVSLKMWCKFWLHLEKNVHYIVCFPYTTVMWLFGVGHIDISSSWRCSNTVRRGCQSENKMKINMYIGFMFKLHGLF